MSKKSVSRAQYERDHKVDVPKKLELAHEQLTNLVRTLCDLGEYGAMQGCCEVGECLKTRAINHADETSAFIGSGI